MLVSRSAARFFKPSALSPGGGMVDAVDLKLTSREGVRVRVPPRVRLKKPHRFERYAGTTH